jgi:flagellar protein FliJ
MEYRTMKARESELRTKRFEADEQSKKIANLEAMIRDFESMASDLDRQIQAEEDRTGVRDRAHFAYSTFAKSASQRRDNLRASVLDLANQLETAQKARGAVVEQLAQAAALPAPRENTRSRRRPERMSSSAMR